MDKGKSPALQMEKFQKDRNSPAHGAPEERGESSGTQGLNLEHQARNDGARSEPPVNDHTDQVENVQTNENDLSARTSETGLEEVNDEVEESSTHVDQPMEENSQDESPRQALDRLKQEILDRWTAEENLKEMEEEALETDETLSISPR